MKIFMTGATGFIGTRVAGVFLKGGHSIVALVRNVTKAQPLKAAGVQLAEGSLKSLALIRQEARNADAVVCARAWQRFAK